ARAQRLVGADRGADNPGAGTGDTTIGEAEITEGEVLDLEADPDLDDLTDDADGDVALDLDDLGPDDVSAEDDETDEDDDENAARDGAAHDGVSHDDTGHDGPD